MTNLNIHFRNAEIDELCEGIVMEYEGEAYGTRPIDIVGIAVKYFKLKILFAHIVEHDPNKLSFLADGVTPLRVLHNGAVQSVIFPSKTIILDFVLKKQQEQCRRCFCIAHELFHQIESQLTGTPVAAFHTEFDRERTYTIDELSNIMNIRECQADRGAAALLMPEMLVKKTYMRYTNNKVIPIYGSNVFLSEDKIVLQEIASFLGVSLTALIIRMKQMQLFEKRDISEFIHTELIHEN